MDDFRLFLGDCLDVMRGLPDNSVDSVVTDPPYGIRFMGKSWDGADIEARTADRRKQASHAPGAGPNGGHKSIAAEAGKYDLTAKGMSAFREFSTDWAREALRVLKPGGHLLSFSSARTYHHMATGIEAAGFEIRDQIMWVFGSGFPKSHNLTGEHEGWGTALKPAHEPICVARKPLIGTVAENVLAHGTGAINIDGCRVPTNDKLGGGSMRATVDRTGTHEGYRRPWMEDPESVKAAAERSCASAARSEELGRWPANLIHDGIETEWARFFYCAKASRADRNRGLTDPGPQFKHGVTLRQMENTERKGNIHPTVKPTDLMRYLCRLVTPPRGIVLDPFMGSGSSGKAAALEGFRFVGIDITPEYYDIAQARIAHALIGDLL